MIKLIYSLKESVIHPFLLSSFFVVFFFSFNIHELTPNVLIFPLVISSIGVFLVWIPLKFFLKSSKKSGLLTSLYVFLFFSFGHIFNQLTNKPELSFELTRTHILIVFLIIFVIGTYFILKTNRKLDNATKITNGFTITLIILVSINIATFYFEYNSITLNEDVSEQTLLSNKFSKGPDIYYIILDAYANTEILRNHLGYENQAFDNFLIENGFQFPSNYTRSNYYATHLSIPSSLNMMYIHEVVKNSENRNHENQILLKMTNNNLVMKNLKSKGYKIIDFDSGWSLTRTLEASDKTLCSNYFMDNRFLLELTRTTIISSFKIVKQLLDPINDLKRDLISCVFNQLPQVHNTFEEPVFVFAHLVIPHPSFVFGPNGESVNNYLIETSNLEKYRKAYLDQVKFVNKKVQDLIIKLTKDSDNPPIIILQSDHGPRNVYQEQTSFNETIKGRFGILNTYYLPGTSKDILYETLTPVNSFRVVFNAYLNATYDLLDDRSYMHKGKNFTDVTSIIKN